MADESENIEARLAAYIDGDLPAQERHDIEQYLASSPAHAQLIASLREQRGQLSSLPQEKAPLEIMDTLQQHLERHALLADPDEAAGPRGSRWSQWTAAAAMLFLAAGLGLLVYQILPGGGKGDHLVIEQNLMNSLSKLPASSSEPSADDMGAADSVTLQPKPVSPSTAPSAAMSPLAMVRREAKISAAQADQTMPQAQMTQAAPPMQQQMAAPVPMPNARHATLSVVSSDPAMSSALIAEYLVQSGVAFDTPQRSPATEPASTQPAAAAILVLHNITAEHARAMLVAISDLQAGKQQVNLQPLPPAQPISTQPANSEAQALAMIGKGDLSLPTPAPTLPAPAEAAPTTQNEVTARNTEQNASMNSNFGAAGAAALNATPAGTQPATNPVNGPVNSLNDVLAGASAKPSADEEAGDLWIVINAAPPATAPAEKAVPAFIVPPPPGMSPPGMSPTTAPATQPMLEMP